MEPYSSPLSKVVKQFGLQVVYTPRPLEEILVYSSNVNRPGLVLAGYYQVFNKQRIQMLGKAEMDYLSEVSIDDRLCHVEKLFEMTPPAVIVAKGIEPLPEMARFAEKYGVPLLKSEEDTSALMGSIIYYLSNELAPRVTRHGVFVEVYGEGILILGDSGVGKSETAIELVKRGHRLVADDAVELRRINSRQIIGRSPENIRHYIELRGIGIVNVARMFGAGAVKVSDRVELVVELEPWDPSKNYDRTGLVQNTCDILGVKIPTTVIPVMPGRNLAVIIETAAINNRMKAMGYNAAEELMEKLGLSNDVASSL